MSVYVCVCEPFYFYHCMDNVRLETLEVISAFYEDILSVPHNFTYLST